MLNPESENNFDDEFHAEQTKVNANRLGLIEALVSFRPPDSTKTAVYKWYDTLRSHTKLLDDLNAAYVNRLQANYEDSNQKIINKMELTLVCLNYSLIFCLFVYSEKRTRRLNCILLSFWKLFFLSIFLWFWFCSLSVIFFFFFFFFVVVVVNKEEKWERERNKKSCLRFNFCNK